MDREMLIEAAKRSCEHNWMTNYLIPLCSECGFTEDGFRYFNRGVEKGFDAALSLLQWKDVAGNPNNLPSEKAAYFVRMNDPETHDRLRFETAEDRVIWLHHVVAYIPVPIPEYVKEKNNE